MLARFFHASHAENHMVATRVNFAAERRYPLIVASSAAASAISSSVRPNAPTS